MLNRLLQFLYATPRKIFLFDGVGALSSALLLLFVVAPFEFAFGMPASIVHPLAIIAFGFAMYSFCGYLFATKAIRTFLLPIIMANVLYCMLTAAMLLYLKQSISLLGIMYFIGEILIILTLVFIEWRVYKHLSTAP